MGPSLTSRAESPIALAITRGVSWALAIWITTTRLEKAETIYERLAPTGTVRSERAPSTPKLRRVNLVFASILEGFPERLHVERTVHRLN
jgi:hypothetical protein